MNASNVPHSQYPSVGKLYQENQERCPRRFRGRSLITRTAIFVLALLLLEAILLTTQRTTATEGVTPQVISCMGNLISNGNFISGNNPGTMPPGSVAGWSRGYGKPQVFGDPGCEDKGYVRLKGGKSFGSAVVQTFNAANKLKQNKKYVLSLCVRNIPQPGYVKFRAIAFNGTLPTTGLHPPPGPNVAIIGHSGLINSSGWTHISLPVWAAGKDYDSLAINVETSDDAVQATGDIDNLCITEVAQAACDEAQIGADGQVVFPANLDPDSPPVYEDVQDYNGSVFDLYGSQCNTQLDTWYQSPNCTPPCPSIGGQIPPEATVDSCSQELAAMGVMTAGSGQASSPMNCDELQNTLSNFKAPPTKDVQLPPIPDAMPPACGSFSNSDPSQPFDGADIVFVHGLKLEHLCDRANQVPGAMQDWPGSPGEFYSGYYKATAQKTWENHIRHFLTDRGYKNRYLVVAYNNSQRLKIGAHAVLSQIRQAMLTGQGVVAPKGMHKECFGKKLVIISHSTGGLVTDVALSIAEQTKTNPAVAAEFGHVGYIADRTRVHIALHGALSGSQLATALVAASFSNSLSLQTIANFIVTTMQCHTSFANIAPIVKNSVLIDLMPHVAQAPSPIGWRTHVNNVPVPVLTVAGGHPGGTLEWGSIVKQGLHKGLDDGVLTMDSQCGNSNPWSAWPSRVVAGSPLYKLRLFDMGIPVLRAAHYFVDQTYNLPPQNYAAGCIPFVAPDGMLTPNGVIPPLFNPLNRYYNHCSFIQTASGHYAGPRGLAADAYGTGANYAPPNFNYEPTLGIPNTEEVRALTCPSLYSSGLVNSAMKNMVGEYVRGRKVTFTFKLFGKKWTWTKWIWKRTYYLLDGYETKTECDYVYDYVLKP